MLRLVWKLENHQSCLKFLLVVASFCLSSNCWVHSTHYRTVVLIFCTPFYYPVFSLFFDRKSIFILKALCLSVVQCICMPRLKSLWSVLLNHLTLKRTSKWNLRSSDCPVQHKKAKKLKSSGKTAWEKKPLQQTRRITLLPLYPIAFLNTFYFPPGPLSTLTCSEENAERIITLCLNQLVCS